MKKLLLAVSGFIVLASFAAALVVSFARLLWEVPVAVVCDRDVKT